jgi:hypothetical protein
MAMLYLMKSDKILNRTVGDMKKEIDAQFEAATRPFMGIINSGSQGRGKPHKRKVICIRASKK